MSVDYALYLVTDAPQRYDARGLLANVEAAVAGGATVVQYRAKEGSPDELLATARALRDLLRPRGVPLIINDRVDLALACGADGVHVGQDDAPPAQVRARLGKGPLLGLSITHPSQMAAVDPDVVDYLGIGPVFPTGSKDDAAPALGLDAFGRLCRETRLPVVAIGGITVENAGEVFAAGAAGIAVVSALSRAQDPAAAARALLAKR